MSINNEVPEIDKVKDTLKRLAAMRDCPTAYEGERANAEAIIKRLCARHGLTLEDIFSDEPKEREFEYKTLTERKLIYAIIAHVLGKRVDGILVGYYPKRRKNKRIYVKSLTNQDYLTISEYVDHYLPEYRLQVKRMMRAFVIANKLFYNDGTPPRTPTREDWEAIKQAQGMAAAPLRKKLTGPEATPCK